MFVLFLIFISFTIFERPEETVKSISSAERPHYNENMLALEFIGPLKVELTRIQNIEYIGIIVYFIFVIR